MINLNEFFTKNPELIKNLKKLQPDHYLNDSLKLSFNMGDETSTMLYYSALNTITEELKKLKEFKNVNRINFLKLPTFLVDLDTNQPINGYALKVNYEIEQVQEDGEIKLKFISKIVEDSIPFNTKAENALTFKINDNFKFN